MTRQTGHAHCVCVHVHACTQSSSIWVSLGGTYEYLPILLTTAITTAMTTITATNAPIPIPTTCPEPIPSVEGTQRLLHQSDLNRDTTTRLVKEQEGNREKEKIDVKRERQNKDKINWKEIIKIKGESGKAISWCLVLYISLASIWYRYMGADRL